MPVQTIAFNQDATGTNPANLVIGEVAALAAGLAVRGAAPIYGAFYTESIVVHDVANNALLTRGVDYQCVELLQDATLKFGKEICTMILVINPLVSPTIRFDYQVVGGTFQNAAGQMVNLYETVIKDNRPIDWVNVLNKPLEYNPALHQHLLADVYGFEAVVTALERIRNAIILSDVPAFESLAQWCMDQINIVKAKVSLVENLPVVTPAEIALGTPVHSYVTHDRMLAITDPLHLHATNLLNPHNTSAQQLGLGLVENLPVVTPADIALGTPMRKYITHDMLLKITANQPPALGPISFINLNTIGATAQVALTAINGFNSSSAVVTFYFRNVALLGAWVSAPPIPFLNTQLTYKTVLTGLVSGTVYGVYATITDPNNTALLVQTLEAQFTTFGLAVDADSSFNITGSIFTPVNLDVVDAEIVSFTATAINEQATVSSKEIVQQAGQLDFIKLIPTASFKPEEILIDNVSVLPTLNLMSQEANLYAGNDLYTVDAGGILTESVISNIATEGEYPVINLRQQICNAPWKQNNGAVSVLKDLGTWATDTPVPVGGYGFSLLTTNRYVYKIGGVENTPTGITRVSTIYKAPIYNNGTIGAFLVDTTISYPIAIGNSTSYLVGNRFYVCGGIALSGTIVATSYYTDIGYDGTIGPWVLDIPYPFSIYYGTALVTPSSVNIIGGADSNGISSALSYRRVINPNGTLGSWVASNSYPVATYMSKGFVTDTAAYILGSVSGISASGSSNAIGMAPVLMDGTLGSWSWTRPFPVALYHPLITQTRNRVWVITAALLPSVPECYYADILIDGTLGDWIKGTSLPGAAAEGELFQTSTRLYLIAGATAGATSTPTVYSVNWDGWAIGNNDTVIEARMPLPALVETHDSISSNCNINHVTTSVDLAWVTGISLPSVQLFSCIARTKTNAYVLGGHSVYPSGTTSNTILRAPIDVNGTLRAWVTEAAVLPNSVTGAAITIIKNRVYILGGYVSKTADVTTEVMYANILADGTLSPWNISSDTLAFASFFATVFKTSNRVYITGGALVSGAGLATVQYAPILPNGDLGNWVLDTSLPGAFCLADAVITKTKVYLLGGALNVGPSSSSGTVTIYQANLLADGSIGPWSLATPLPAPCDSAGVIVTANRVWVLGGYGSVNGNAVYRADINPDGTLGTWGLSPNTLATYQSTTKPLVTKTHVYLLSSNGSNGVWTANVQSAPFDGWDIIDNVNVKSSLLKNISLKPVTGYSENYTSINPWFKTTTTVLDNWAPEAPLPVVRLRSHTLATSTRLYLIGGSTIGFDSTTAIYYSIFNPDGTLGPWTLDNNTLPIPLMSGNVIKTKKYAYMVGGSTTGNTSAFNTLYFAPIDSNGVLGAWTTAGTIAMGSCNNNVIVLGNYMYILGTYVANVAAPSTTIVRYTIAHDGTLTTATTLTLTMPLPTEQYTTIITKSRLYIVGGQGDAINGTACRNNVFSVDVDTNGILGTVWKTEALLPVTISAATVVAAANRAWLIGGYQARVLSNAIYTAPIDEFGVLGAWSLQPTTALAQTGWCLSVAVTKTRVYLLGGTSIGGAYNEVMSCPFNGWEYTNTGYVEAVPKITNYTSEPSAQRYDVTTTSANLTGWISDVPMPAGLILGGVLTTTSRVYKIGGYLNGGIVTGNVYSAPIDSAGVIGVWTADTPLPGPLTDHKVIKTKNRVYTIGGYTGVAAAIAPCYTAIINPDGTLGPWGVHKSLPEYRDLFGIAVTKSKVYVLGGANAVGYTNTVLVADINADGTLGDWLPTYSLPYVDIYSPNVIVTRNYVYIVSGNATVTGLTRTMSNIGYYAYINQDGTLAPWQATPATSLLPIGLDVSGLVVTSNRVWVIGGVSSLGLSISTVYTCSIDATGLLTGVWTADSVLPGNCGFTDAVVTKSKVYLLGMDPVDGNGKNAQPIVYRTNFAGWSNQNYGSRVRHTVNTVVPLTGALPVKAFKGGQLLECYIGNSKGTGVLSVTPLTYNVISTSDVITQTGAPLLGVGRFAKVSLTLNIHDVASQIKGDLWHG